jgi:Ca2+/Na+ antiporter
MIPQIPYSAIGIGIAVIFGVWAFVIAETFKERAIIAGIPAVILFCGALFRSRAGQLITLIASMLYGLGLIIYLRFNGMEIR